MNPRFIITFALCFITMKPFAQDQSNIKFGKITPDDFKQTVYSIDSNANAVVIADIGSTEMIGNTMGNLSLEFKRFRRVRILNKNGYDAASTEIQIYTNGHNEEELNGLRAVTYNLENGKVVETKLDKETGIFKDNLTKNIFIKKFTFPNIREGCIIEYEYKIKSDYIFNIQPWIFQGEYPTLWSEYKVSIPEFYYYVTIGQGYQPYYINTKQERSGYYAIPDNGNEYSHSSARTDFSAVITDWRWVIKDAPALKAESYTSTIRNHLSSVQFQLAELRYPFIAKNVIGSWQELCSNMLKDEDFGSALDRNNGWMNDEIRTATKDATSDLDKAKNIFSFIRNRMNCTSHSGVYLGQTIKEALNKSKGTESEINMLLTAMLLKAGLKAEPVMLSTRSHGYVLPLYPLMERFNYVISRVKIDGQYYYLDASHPRLGFGMLAPDTYNGQAQVVNKEASTVQLDADSIRESKVTSVIIINDEKGNISGSLNESPGPLESYTLRDLIKEKGSEQYFSDVKKDVSSDVIISSQHIDSLDQYDEPLTIHYDFDIKSEKEDIIYFNPMLNGGWKENPFKSAHRMYPVEMPSTMDEVYLLRLDVPEGYVVDELPKPLMVKLNENDDGFFEYVLAESGGTISLRSRICLKRAYYQPEEYETLREFFNMIVKKHSEQIVFKKKK